MLKEKLKTYISDNTTRKSRLFDLVIQILIVLSIISFSLETEPDLESSAKQFLHLFEIFIVIIFTIEYILRIYVADNKWKYVFSFYGIIDLLAILPFYLTFGLDLMAVRILRIFRIFRVLKLVRYNKAISRLGIAFKITKEEIYLFLIVSGILLYFSAAGIYYFEHNAQPDQFSSIFSSLWWAVGTLTTVGYGDVYPITVGGKVFTFFVLMVGIGVVAVPAALLAEGLAEARQIEEKNAKDQDNYKL